MTLMTFNVIADFVYIHSQSTVFNALHCKLLVFRLFFTIRCSIKTSYVRRIYTKKKLLLQTIVIMQPTHQASTNFVNYLHSRAKVACQS